MKSKINKIADELKKLALNIGDIPSIERLGVMSKKLESYDFEAVAACCDRLSNSESRFPPFAKFYEILQDGGDSPNQIAVEVTNALVHFSPDDSQALNQLSPIAQAVIFRSGGFRFLAGTVKSDELPTYQAQWRELARSLIKEKLQCEVNRIEFKPNKKLEKINIDMTTKLK